MERSRQTEGKPAARVPQNIEVMLHENFRQIDCMVHRVDENRSVLEEWSSNGKTLALTAGKAHPAFSHKRGVTFRQPDNKLMRVSLPRRSNNLILIGAGTGICNVFGYGG